MEKYFNLDEAIHYLLEEHNAGEYLIYLMLKKFYDNPHCLVSKENIDKWLDNWLEKDKSE